MAVGETRQVKVTFPVNYQAANLAGKDAEFEVTAKSIEAPAPITLDDEFAKTLGMESLEKLKAAIKDRIAREHADWRQRDNGAVGRGRNRDRRSAGQSAARR